jgi:hypothetical protein
MYVDSTIEIVQRCCTRRLISGVVSRQDEALCEEMTEGG